MAQKPTYEQLEQRIKELETKLNSRKNRDHQRRKARQNYRRFLQFLPYPVLVIGADRLITYLNPAFTKTFGWTSEDLKGKKEDPFIPADLKNEIKEEINRLPVHKNILQLKTKRVTKDGKILDVIIRIGVEKDKDNHPGEMIIVLKDTTMELRNERNRNTIIRISQSLPEYPDLKKLLFYVNTEIKNLLGTQGANVILLDKTQKHFYLVSAAHDDPETRERIEKIKFSIDELLSGQVIKTGESIIVNNFSDRQHRYSSRDQKIGYKIKNVLLVPLRNKDSIIGILAADNKKSGDFDNTDLQSLNTIATTVALSIENARVSRRLRKAYEEMKSLNKAKDKMINHLSHELKTPVAILMSSHKILSKRLTDIEKSNWMPTLERIKRNLKRIIEIEDELYDIVEKKELLHNNFFSLILEQCQDELETLIAEETGETGVISKVRQRIEDIFTTEDPVSRKINLSEFAEKRVDALKPATAHRDIEFITHIEPAAFVNIPVEPLRKTIDGLIKNAVENSPDGKSIDIFVTNDEKGVMFTAEARKRVFEGFFATQDIRNYSSKTPFDFNAGGKGADLLRMKIFSEKYNFKISMSSKRCSNIPENSDICPGSIKKCRQASVSECDGHTIVSCLFPAAMV